MVDGLQLARRKLRYLCRGQVYYSRSFSKVGKENILYTPGADLEIEDQTAIEKQ
jgi:hypothetical protein